MTSRPKLPEGLPKPTWADEEFGVALYRGDCGETMREMESESIDAIVTDPPYGMKFMGNSWDYSIPSVDIWRECLRVLKPGGHLLSFAGTRTHHRMACAIEDAGFEIRDMIAWVYGSGFPKSRDVGKAIDKAARRGYVEAALRLGMELPSNSLHDWTKGEHSPGDQWWARFKAILSVEDWQRIEREVVGTNDRKAGWFTAQDGHDITAPATPAARQWNGWGTALKPAFEPITVARKPLIGTVAENVLAHGTGALNIEACRVGTETVKTCGGDKFKGNGIYGKYATCEESEHQGRWPANLILDGSPEVLAVFPESAGQHARSTGLEPSSKTKGIYGRFKGRVAFPFRGDSGSAARFFYTAKADGKDRGVQSNDHPTVKPTDLIRYLVMLVAPPGGVILDPFMGSGTTLRVALDLGHAAIGIDSDEHSCEIAAKRLSQKVLDFAPVEKRRLS